MFLLGLAITICVSIMAATAIITQNHKGTFTVDPAPGKGTCFTIKLPLV